MKKINTMLCALLASMSMNAQDGNLVLTTPLNGVDYMVSALSPNGKWACGNLMEASQRAFLWNLTSGEIFELCSPGANSIAMSVSNDGVVAGSYETTEGTPNNVPTETYGVWKDGKWTELQLENEENGTKVIRDGYVNSVSPNGKYFAGIGGVGNDRYFPVIWNNGNIQKIDDKEGAVYDISDNGDIACGWTTHPQKNNRTCVIWKKDKDGNYTKTFMDLTSPWAAGPFSVASGISPNNRYVVGFNRVWDLENDKYVEHDFSYATGGFQLFGVTNDGSAYGYHDPGDFGSGEERAAIKIGLDHKTVILRDEFIKQGVNLDEYPYIQMAVGISEDEKTYALTGYTANYYPFSMIVKLNVDTLFMAPVSLKSHQIEGVGANSLVWKAPLKNRHSVKGYNVYRDGKKVNSELVKKTSYIDTDLATGQYAYAVTAVYGEKESEKSVGTTVKITDVVYNQVRHLAAYPSSRNDVRLLWDDPYSVLPVVKYYDENDDLSGIGGGNYSFEGAIAVRSSELALYKKKGYKVSQISFIPKTQQKSWKVNFYTSDNDDQPIYSEEIPGDNLVYGIENFHTLKTPLEIPEGKDLIMAIAVDVEGFGGYNVLGMTPKKAEARYSDLIRQKGENDFYSMYERAMSSEEPYEFNICWTMGVHMSKAGEDAAVKQYIVSANGKEVGRTQENKFRINNLNDGTYTFDVVTEYANGNASVPASAHLAVKSDESIYRTIHPTVITAPGKATLTWDTPLDDDATFISYATDKCQGGEVGSKENQYSYMVATIYDNNKLDAYEDFEITGFRFYPLSDADFTFYLKKNGKDIAEVALDNGSGYVKNQWNTVRLDHPISLNRRSEYMLMLDCYDVTPEEAPVGLDAQAGYPNKSDLYSQDDGENFSSLIIDGGNDGNWMIGLEVAAKEKKTLPIEGYNIYLSNKKHNEQLTTATEYVIDQLEPATYQARVNPVYGNGIGEKKSHNVTFVIDMAAGIEDMSNTQFNIVKNENQIEVKGANVNSIEVYAMNGALVAQNNGNLINISNLGTGAYVLKINANGKVASTKISVRR